MKNLFRFYLAGVNKRNLSLLFGLVLLLVYVLILLKTAWLGDDAYITFRTIDNFVNGYGLRWNIAERVQSYTHPLWLFLLSAMYFFTRKIFFTAILTSIIISIATVYVLAFKITRSYQSMILVLLTIIFSKAFVDYSTSGLENPLTNLLLVLFCYIYLKNNTVKGKIFLLSLLSSLILINRMDCFLLVLPAFLYYLIKTKGNSHYLIIITGFLPFLLWELFSLFYYGFPFPNTAYAKLNTGLDRYDIITQGLKYFSSSFNLDPLTLTMILLIIILSIFKRNRNFMPLTIGMGFYLVYIVLIGGDFMNGRFIVAPFLISIIILSQIEFKSKKKIFFSYEVIIFLGFLSLYFNLDNYINMKYNRSALVDASGICDERLFYYPFSNLIDATQDVNMPNYEWVNYALMNKSLNKKFLISENVGYAGFFIGKDCFVLDTLALSDPLLARLPSNKNSRIGHFARSIPNGYIETLISGENKIKNYNLSKYYEKIVLITRGDLLNKDRLKAIWKMNTGQYNYLLDSYINLDNSNNKKSFF